MGQVEGGTGAYRRELSEEVKGALEDFAKLNICPEVRPYTTVAITLAILSGVALTLEAIADGLAVSAVPGCTKETAEEDLGQVTGLIKRARGMIRDRAVSDEAIDGLLDEALELMRSLYTKYYICMSLLARG